MTGEHRQSAESDPLNAEQTALMEQAAWGLDSWKRAVEAKDWPALADLIGLKEIFIAGEPRNAEMVAAKVTEMAAGLCDFEVVYGTLTPRTVTPDCVNLSFTARVLWTTSATFEEHELDIVGHVGFAATRDSLTPRYLLLDKAPPSPAPASAPAAPAQPAAAAPAEAAVPDAAPPQAALSDERVAAAAAQYFARADAPPAAAPTRGKKHIVYLPVVLDADVVRDLLS
ncbi:hypothetical protein [Azospirillum argentinense]